MAPAGTFQQRWIWPRNASISLWVSFWPLVVFFAPSEAVSVERLAPPPDAFCLLSRAATSSSTSSFFSASLAAVFFSAGLSESLRSGALAVWACGGCGRASGDGAVFGSVTLSASGVSATTGSGTGSGLTSCFGFGSGVTSVAGTGLGSSWATFGASGFGSGAGSGFGSGAAASAVSTSRGFGSGVGGVFRSTSFSPTSRASGTGSGRSVGFGAAFSAAGAFFSPCWTWVIDSTGTMSTGKASTSATSNGRGADRENRPNPSSAACMMTEDVSPAFISGQLSCSWSVTRPRLR